MFGKLFAKSRGAKLGDAVQKLDDRLRSTRGEIESVKEKVQSIKSKLGTASEKSSHILQQTEELRGENRLLAREVESLKMLCGRMAVDKFAGKPPGTPFKAVEFKVFSQWGEDGILQHLIHHLPITRTEFVEFGVEDYREASTRFLLMNDNWRGLVMDGSEAHIQSIQGAYNHWCHDLTARCAFISPENINQLLEDAGFTGDIGIYSVDVDGMDYWIWKATTVVSPIIVICEYNGVFGSDIAVTVPPDAGFMRSKAHYSNLFYGASLSALEHLGREKGYSLVGSNTAGNNAFFIRQDMLGAFPARTAKEVFVEARYREGRDPEGRLTLASPKERRETVKDLVVYNVRTGATQRLSEAWAEAAS